MFRLSGRQLTIVVASVCAGAIIAPMSVSYAVDQFINIADANTGVTAQVGRDGTLNVESRAGVPQRAFNLFFYLSGGRTLIAHSSATDRLAITELTVFQSALADGSGLELDVWVYQGKTTTTCPAHPPTGQLWKMRLLRDLRVPGFSNGTLELNFNGPPLVLPDNSGPTTCLYAFNYYGRQAPLHLGLSGYRYAP